MTSPDANAAKKRDRDAATDTGRLEAPAQKLVKTETDAGPVTQYSSTAPTLDIPHGPNGADSRPLSVQFSFEGHPSIRKMSQAETVASATGAERVPGAQAVSKDQHGSNTADATEHGSIPIMLADDEATNNVNTARIVEHYGDLFAAPNNSVLVHACNIQGSWGAGIAKAFRMRYPQAFEMYKEHCLVEHHPRKNPVQTGSCLLIPPREQRPGAPKHWIACLFTSAGHGRNKDPKDKILQNTAPAFSSMLNRLNAVRLSSTQPSIKEVRMCEINSGLFAVKWEDTKEVLERVLAANAGAPTIHVYSRPTADDSGASTKQKRDKGQTTIQSFFCKP